MRSGEHHRAAEAVGALFAYQPSSQGQGKLERRTWTATGDHRAILDHRLFTVGTVAADLVGDGGVRGEVLAHGDAVGDQGLGGGANGGDLAAGGLLLLEQAANLGGLGQSFAARATAGEDDQVEGSLDLGQRGIRQQGHAAATRDRVGAVETGEDDLDAAAAQDIDDDDGLHLLGTVGEGDQDAGSCGCGHGLVVSEIGAYSIYSTGTSAMTSRILYCLAFAVVMTAITVASLVAMVVLVPLFIVQTVVHVVTGKTRVGRKDGVGREVAEDARVPRSL